MASSSLHLNPTNNNANINNKKKNIRHLTWLISILILLTVALSFTNRYLTYLSPKSPQPITLPETHVPKARTFPNGSSPIRLGSSLNPPISPKDAVSGSGSELLQTNSPPEIIEKPQGAILEPSLGPPVNVRSEGKSGGVVKGGGTCDVYSGSWVKDEEGRHPLYSAGQCPFVDSKFACQENGRKDKEYLKWRWKPHACDMPRFNATDFLERLRGKVMMIVGDSMSRNQFGSLLCLLREALAVKSKIHEKNGYKISSQQGHYTVHFPDYNCSVKYVRSFFLVSEGTHIDGRGESRATLKLDIIDQYASQWKTADILLFGTGDWWNREKTNSGKNFFQERDVVHPWLDPKRAYRRGLVTWATWIDNNLKPGKNMVFYRGLGAAHFRGGDWYSRGGCNRETGPTFQGRVLDVYPWKMRVVEEVLKRMRFPVVFLNITKMTNSRKDAHPSRFGDAWSSPMPGFKRREDCSHWCLPGVPDTWNELLYASIVMGR